MTFEIVAGTYEQFLLGYNFQSKCGELKQSFAVRSHTGSIKCVHTLNRFVASGGTDDRIFIYDLISRKEHCMLTQHVSSVTCVKFTPDRSHIISGSADGTLAIVRVGNWQLEKLWEKAHKGAIVNIAIHSSGKLALTLGSDHTLQTWNLIKGRQAYVINLSNKSKDPSSLEHIMWSPCGSKFLLGGGYYTEIWSIEKGGILKSIKHSFKVSCCIWYKKNTLLVGYENGQLGITNIETSKINVIECHSSRLKSIATNSSCIITGSSDGVIKVWDKEFQEIAKCNTGCRITCLDIAIPPTGKEDSHESEKVEMKRRKIK
ncbi:p21-activated protein kinase-interacting protein 1-like [Agrilus planipennis]|uniref:P21-activated protein kinase-interacting protein 1-like n=1 Tax=Agrilus planipennis TaxID=224129 RepID=A0A1W4X4D9_AGRPL|nr:p21-activated protein kinase-interacting protein 1-like [Agrilus planipennis]XP_018330977.1 p21-activated protein kinase-interacting protein 1-like [Agrilus planipennis]